MNAGNKSILWMFAGLTVTALAFQNCAKAQFVPTDVDGVSESVGANGEDLASQGDSDLDPNSGSNNGNNSNNSSGTNSGNPVGSQITPSAGNGNTGNSGATGSTGNSGSGSSGTDVAVVEMNCSNQTLTNKDMTVAFPTPPKCDWEMNGNSSRRNLYIQARSEQSVDLALPANAVICKLEFQFVKQDMHYDDQIIMTYNGYVLASSFKPMLDLLPKEDGLYRYNWASLKEQKSEIGGFAPYIAGQEDGSSSISMPATQTNGQIQMSIRDSTFHKFAAKKAASANHSFGFITTGDNDANVDCQHKPVNFSVRAHYYLPK